MTRYTILSEQATGLFVDGVRPTNAWAKQLDCAGSLDYRPEGSDSHQR